MKHAGKAPLGSKPQTLQCPRGLKASDRRCAPPWKRLTQPNPEYPQPPSSRVSDHAEQSQLRAPTACPASPTPPSSCPRSSEVLPGRRKAKQCKRVLLHEPRGPPPPLRGTGPVWFCRVGVSRGRWGHCEPVGGRGQRGPSFARSAAAQTKQKQFAKRGHACTRGVVPFFIVSISRCCEPSLLIQGTFLSVKQPFLLIAHTSLLLEEDCNVDC